MLYMKRVDNTSEAYFNHWKEETLKDYGKGMYNEHADKKANENTRAVTFKNPAHLLNIS